MSLRLLTCQLLPCPPHEGTGECQHNTHPVINCCHCHYLSSSEAKSGVAERAFFVFSSLAVHSIPVLLDTALSVITPVTRGVARPVDPLCMTDRHKVCWDLVTG